MIKIEVLTRPTKSDLADVNVLAAQIADKPHLLSFNEFKRVVMQKNCRTAVARLTGTGKARIIGMATVTSAHIPTGLVAIIEDVVVDDNFRGRGIGKKLIQRLIKIASRLGAKHISLYTRADRAAANKMYQNLGFFKKEVNYYRINFLLPKPASQKEIKELLAERKFLKDDQR